MSGPEPDVGVLRPGLLVGVYRLTGPLGEGGMGVVFGAVDTKLQRPVAVKFLSNRLADAEGRRRFQREAQLASSLNHPHILTVHDVGEFEGSQYLVTELVDGGTLKEWAAVERRTWRQIVDLLIGAADGLASAHQAGILHRDVKPQNVLVAKSGYAKLADFGLAKLAPAGTDLTSASTAEETRAGVVVGTVAYMSPEQAAGKMLDARSDVFSFGVMLYELLAGRRPFAGLTELETLQSIMHSSAPTLGPTIPFPLRIIVEKSLEKDPADRYQTMRDLVVDLRRVARRPAEDSGRDIATAAVAPPALKRRWALAVSAVALVAAAAVVGRWIGAPSPAGLSTSVAFQRITDSVGIEEMPAVSPDGKTIAYVAPLEGRRQIWVRLLAGGPSVQITSDDADHDYPRWFPDSSTIVFFSPATTEGESGALWEVSAFGGTPRRLASSVAGADISHDGRRVATVQRVDDRFTLVTLSRDDGSTKPLTQLPEGANIGPHYPAPRWSPDDRSISYSADQGNFNIVLFVIDSYGGEPRPLTRALDMQGHTWLPDGSGLIYASATGATMRYPATTSLRTVSLDGASGRQLTLGDVWYMHPDLVLGHGLFASRVRLQSDIWRFPVSGSPQVNVQNGIRITHQTGQVQTPSVSPDGKEVAYLSDSGGHGNVWVTKVDGSEARQLTFERDPEWLVGVPVWSPVGDRIAFIRTKVDEQAQWLVNTDGSGLRRLEGSGTGASWSQDGRWLYHQIGSCIYKTAAEGGSAIRVRCDAATAAVSSDGSTIYFTPTVIRQNELFKASPPETGPTVPLGQYARSRVPLSPQHFVLSPDDHWLALPLKDAATTNIWTIPVVGGPFRQITDFGRRAILIARQVSWSPDSRFIYAAVIEQDADVVLLDGIVSR